MSNSIIILSGLLIAMAWYIKKINARLTDIENKLGENSKASNGLSNVDEDYLYKEAKEIVIKSGKVSPALLQRRLKIGYSRASRLIDVLVENGVIGKDNEIKSGEIVD